MTSDPSPAPVNLVCDSLPLVEDAVAATCGLDVLPPTEASPAAAPEPALRLAHVYMEMGDERAAREMLERLIVRRDLAPPEAYLARLFLGRMHEQHDELPSATEMYRQAALVLPSGQSARLALAHLRYRTGNGDGAADAVGALLEGQSGVETTDPWFDYLAGYVERGRFLLDQLRAEVQR